MPQDKFLESALNYDALADAEKLVENDHILSPEMKDFAALTMHISRGKMIERLLKGRKDTTFHNTLKDYLEIVQREGFKQLLELGFSVPHGDGCRQELFFVFWHPDGILLRFDTYRTEDINGSAFYYNIRPKGDRKGLWSVISSGGWCFDVEEDKFNDSPPNFWAGCHDGREALCYHIERLRDEGEFMPVWKQAPHIWLLHYGDHNVLTQLDQEGQRGQYKDYINTTNSQRLDMLGEVGAMIKRARR